MAELINANEQKTLMELSSLWMQANQEVLSTILNRNLEIAEATLIDKLAGKETKMLARKDFFAFPITISSGILGNTYLVFSKSNLAVLIDLIIGGDGSSPMTEFDELHMSVLEEAINQIAGTLETILSDNLLRKINVKLGEPEKQLKKLLQNLEMVCFEYELELENLAKFNMEVLFPTDFASELARQLALKSEARISQPAVSAKASAGAKPGKQQGGTPMYRKAAFSQLTESDEEQNPAGLGLIMDIPLELTVVLGKTGISVKELVELGPGKVIELEKLAGEPVELFVNEKLVGFGEVIVIEENFGIRVIDVHNPGDAANPSGG
ncbi:MAG: flagellar motor switch protein FliN [Vulcanimicrobiota bacterium]